MGLAELALALAGVVAEQPRQLGALLAMKGRSASGPRRPRTRLERALEAASIFRARESPGAAQHPRQHEMRRRAGERGDPARRSATASLRAARAPARRSPSAQLAPGQASSTASAVRPGSCRAWLAMLQSARPAASLGPPAPGARIAQQCQVGVAASSGRPTAPRRHLERCGARASSAVAKSPRRLGERPRDADVAAKPALGVAPSRASASARSQSRCGLGEAARSHRERIRDTTVETVPAGSCRALGAELGSAGADLEGLVEPRPRADVEPSAAAHQTQRRRSTASCERRVAAACVSALRRLGASVEALSRPRHPQRVRLQARAARPRVHARRRSARRARAPRRRARRSRRCSRDRAAAS